MYHPNRIDAKKSGATHGGAALVCRTSVFAIGENLGTDGIDFRRALKLLMDTKKEDTTQVVPSFLVDLEGFEPLTSAMRTQRSPS